MPLNRTLLTLVGVGVLGFSFKAEASPKLPTFFLTPKIAESPESWWQQTGCDTFEEEYPENLHIPNNRFRVGDAVVLNGVAGTILIKTDGLKIFVPDMGTGSSWLSLKSEGKPWQKFWRQLSNAKQQARLLQAFRDDDQKKRALPTALPAKRPFLANQNVTTPPAPTVSAPTVAKFPYQGLYLYDVSEGLAPRRLSIEFTDTGQCVLTDSSAATNGVYQSKNVSYVMSGRDATIKIKIPDADTKFNGDAYLTYVIMPNADGSMLRVKTSGFSINTQGTKTETPALETVLKKEF